MRVLLIQFFLIVGIFTAQSNPLTKKQALPDSTGARSIYIEYGGPSAIYSVTYDTRFARNNNGWGIRAGFGFLPSQGINNISVPVQVNYLLGSTRSEEHTSETQSLMRISYDVFCLKKKTNK